MRRIPIVANSLQADLQQGDILCLYATLKRTFYAVVTFIKLGKEQSREHLAFCKLNVHAVIEDSYRQGDEPDEVEYEYEARRGHLYYPLFTLEDDATQQIIDLLRADLFRTRPFTANLYQKLRQGDIVFVEKMEEQKFTGIASFVQREGEKYAIVNIFDMGQEIEVTSNSLAYPIFKKTEATVKTIASLMNIGCDPGGWMRSIEYI